MIFLKEKYHTKYTFEIKYKITININKKNYFD